MIHNGNPEPRSLKPVFPVIPTLLVSLILAACVTSPEQQMSKEAALSLVQRLPNNLEKHISLALIGHPDTTYRIDEYGYPAWRWRGDDDIGACVHIDPKSGQPYLENQFPKSLRTSTPKYIDFGTDGEDWMCRIHKRPLGIDYQNNWSSEQCHREGRVLTELVASDLAVR